jgi:hypothetical protein
MNSRLCFFILQLPLATALLAAGCNRTTRLQPTRKLGREQLQPAASRPTLVSLVDATCGSGQAGGPKRSLLRLRAASAVVRLLWAPRFACDSTQISWRYRTRDTFSATLADDVLAGRGRDPGHSASTVLTPNRPIQSGALLSVAGPRAHRGAQLTPATGTIARAEQGKGKRSAGSPAEARASAR